MGTFKKNESKTTKKENPLDFGPSTDEFIKEEFNEQ